MALTVEELRPWRLNRQLLARVRLVHWRLRPMSLAGVPCAAGCRLRLPVFARRRLLPLPRPSDHSPGALVGRGVGEEVEQEDIIELEAL